MKWKKHGLIFKAEGQFGWISSHAQIPTVLVLPDCFRVYFATRPEAGMTYIAMMDIDKSNPAKILKLYEKPVLTPGQTGYFDEHGVMPSFLWRENDKIYMYYTGWSRRVATPYSNWIGLAVSHDKGLTFEKMFDGPVIDRTKYEIFSATSFGLIQSEAEYIGFYTSGTGWHDIDGRLEHSYEIVRCESADLIEWKRSTRKIITAVLDIESNTRQAIIKINDIWHMWFCFRGVTDFRDGCDSYKMGYAWSENTVNWNRDDSEAGMNVSVDGWDSTMLCYPYIVEDSGKVYLFYNGNGFGQTGFGYAELEL